MEAEVENLPVYRRRARPPVSSTDFSAESTVDAAQIVAKARPWRNRSFSVRGRISIAAAALSEDFRPIRISEVRAKAKCKGKGKPPLPVHQGKYEKERQYFQEVDAYELLEESPSPAHRSTWASSLPVPPLLVPSISSALHKWLISCPRPSPSTTLSKLLETPPASPIRNYPDITNLDVAEMTKSNMNVHSVTSRIHDYLLSDTFEQRSQDIETAFGNLSLKPARTSLAYVDPFATILAVCGQTSTSTLMDVFSGYWFRNRSTFLDVI